MSKKRVLSFFLVFCMLVLMLPGTVFAEVPVTEEPVYEEPMYDELTDEEPAYEEPSSEEPVYEDFADEKSQYEEPANEEPAYEETVAGDAMTEEPASEAYALEEPVIEEALYGELAPEEPGTEEAIFEEPLPEELVVEEAAVSSTGETEESGELLPEEIISLEEILPEINCQGTDPVENEKVSTAAPTTDERKETISAKAAAEKAYANNSVYSGTCGDSLTWSFDDSSGELTVSGTGSMTEFGTSQVAWKSYRDAIETVIIEDGVSSIGSNAFRNCQNLTSVTIGSTVSSIGNCSFQNCSGLDDIILPSNLTSIGTQAFQGCTGFVDVSLPSKVTSIGVSAFADCTGLKSITIPSTVTEIRNSAFSGCSALTGITLPSGIQCVNASTFADCWQLDSVTIPGSVMSIEQRAFSNCFALSSVSIETGVKKIGEYAFQNCGELRSIMIPESVTSIEQAAFANCSSLTEITLPSQLTTLAFGVFGGCKELTHIVIPTKVASIESQAFDQCISLTSIIFAGSPPRIADNSFSGVSADVYYPANGSWKTSDRQDYGGTLTWKEYTVGAPIITIQPKNAAVASGARTTFSVTASGSNLSYQWQVYNASTGKWVDSGISSAKTATLSFTVGSGHNGLKYRCAVKNGVGTVYSSAATLTVMQPPVISSQPKNVTAANGAKASFSVTASGNNLSYQWQVYNTSTGKWVNSGISSAKTATLSFTVGTGHNGLKYRCAVTNSGGTVYSSAATLTVLQPPVISSQPKNVTAANGAKASFTVTASGSNLSYQWQVYNTSTGKWVNSGISSAKTATLSFTVGTSHNGLKYRCVVKNGAGTVNSNAATLTVK